MLPLPEVNLSVLAQYGDINLVHAPVSFNDESYYGGITGIIIQEFILETIFGIYARLILIELMKYNK